MATHGIVVLWIFGLGDNRMHAVYIVSDGALDRADSSSIKAGGRAACSHSARHVRLVYRVACRSCRTRAQTRTRRSCACLAAANRGTSGGIVVLHESPLSTHGNEARLPEKDLIHCYD